MYSILQHVPAHKIPKQKQTLPASSEGMAVCGDCAHLGGMKSCLCTQKTLGFRQLGCISKKNLTCTPTAS